MSGFAAYEGLHKWLQGLLTYPAPAKKEEDEEEKPGDKFEGTLSHGQRDGKGKYVWSNGCYYDGQYKDHMRHGHGALTFPDKSRYEGMHECSIFAPCSIACYCKLPHQPNFTKSLGSTMDASACLLAIPLMLLFRRLV